MTEILHVIQHLSLGGASRALLGLAKHSGRTGPYRHRVASLLPVAPEAAMLAAESGVEVLDAPEPSTLRSHLAQADLVQVHWWNNPEIIAWLHSPLPPVRLILWYHVAGQVAPQVITPELTRMADLNVATNPWSHAELPVFRALSPEEQRDRVTMIVDPADFDRVDGVQSRPHSRFHVGYIGTVDFVKMHPRYVPMSASVRLDEVRFVVCGQGCEGDLREQARQLGAEERFDFRGYVQDIRPVLEILDVYGYPLCPDTYASGELNLQEVMWAGIPPVVFPHGGIRGLVEHDRTGLVVHTEEEYRDALEHLYHHPADRVRLGQAAARHARNCFGAANAARRIQPLYDRLLARPKRPRTWGTRPETSLLDQPVSLFDLVTPPGLTEGSRFFLESLGDAAAPFIQSLMNGNPRESLAADRCIARSSRLMRSNGCGGIGHYRQHFGDDPWLRYWHGLVCFEDGRLDEARAEFLEAFRRGSHRGRAAWRYLVATTRSLAPSRSPDHSRSGIPPIPTEMAQALETWLAEIDSQNHADVESDPEFHQLRNTLQALADAGGPGSPAPAVAPVISSSRRQAGSNPPAKRPPAAAETIASRFADLAETHLRAGDASAARDCLERALDSTPDDPCLLVALAGVQGQLGDLPAAHATLQHLIAVEPEVASNHAHLAGICLQLELIPEFERALGRSLEIDPRNLPALRLLAETNFKTGRFPETAATCQRILGQAPAEVPVLLLLGAALGRCENYREAAGAFAAVLQVEPGHALAAENLAVCRQKLESTLSTHRPPASAPPAPRTPPLTPPTSPAPAEVTPSARRARGYGEDWDSYVRHHREYARQEPTNRGRTDLVYPGDEWGKPSEWRAFAQRYLRPYLPADGTGIAVELGQGSGKYTLEIVDRARRILCFDVSEAFLEVARERLATQLAAGQVELEKLGLHNCNEITDSLTRRGLLAHVDLLFSIDSMVHVELHTLFAYFIAASHSLKLGGHLVMTVASCTNPGGFQRLIDETAWYYGGHRPGHQFYFLSPDIVRYLARQLGLEVIQLEEGRDITFVARKVRPPTVQLEPCAA